MTRRLDPRILIVALGGVALTYLPSACSSAPASSAKHADTTPTSTGSGTTTAGPSPTPTPPPCSSTSGSGTGGTGSGTGGSGSAPSGSGSALDFELTSAPSFSDVQSIVQTNCSKSGCHDGQTTSPDLTQQAGVDSNASSEAADIMSGKMPNTGPKLSDTDKATLLAYLAAAQNFSGTLTGSAASGSGVSGTGSSSGGGSSGGNPCPPSTPSPSSPGGSSPSGTGGTTSGTTTVGDPGNTTPGAPDSAVNATIFHDSDVQACNQKGFIYNYAHNACDTAKYPAPFQCTHAGVLGAYQNNTQVNTILSGYDAKNMTYAQCGIEGNTPVLIVICPTTDNGNTCLSENTVKTSTSLPAVTLQYFCIGKAPGSNCTAPAQ